MVFLYIHGFNSSPASYKANCFAQFLSDNHPDDQFICPQLSDLPSVAIEKLSQLIESLAETSGRYSGQSSDTSQFLPKVVLIGSSLGGFYATWLAEQYHLKAVLVNPAVNPQKLLVDYLGKNKNYYSGEEYIFTREHIVQLDALTTHTISRPEQLLVLLQTGDKVLDYRLAEKKYCQSKLLIEHGGDHSFEHFERHCDRIYQFLAQ